MMPVVLFSAGVIITGKTAVAHYGPFTIIFFRFLIALLILLPLAKKYFVKFRWKDLTPLTLVGLIGFFLYNFMIVNGLKHTSASNISIISALIPLTTLIIEVIIFKTSIRKTQIVAIVLAFTSVLIVITKGQLLNILNISWSKGDLYMLFGVCCISTYSIFNSRLKMTYHPMQVLCYYFFTATLFSFPLALLELPSKFSLLGFSAIIYQAVFGTAATYILIQFSLKKFGTNKSMIYFNLIPIVALLMSVIILGEAITIPLIISTILILISIWISA